MDLFSSQNQNGGGGGGGGVLNGGGVLSIKLQTSGES